MKKAWIIVVAVIVLGVTGAALYLMNKKEQPAVTNKVEQTSNTAMTTSALKACAVLTPELAEKVLGTMAQKGQQTPDTKGRDIVVSDCVYTTPTATIDDVKMMRTATLLVRSPLTKEGQTSNKAPFDLRPADAMAVEGLGVAAYWDPSLGQLNVLKDDYWYILSIGGNKASEHTLEAAQSMAGAIGLRNGI